MRFLPTILEIFSIACITAVFLWILFVFTPFFSSVLPNREMSLEHPQKIRQAIFNLPIEADSKSIKNVYLGYELNAKVNHISFVEDRSVVSITLTDGQILKLPVTKVTLINDSPYNQNTIKQYLLGQDVSAYVNYDFKNDLWYTQKIVVRGK